ncbi:MAG TPA: O-antigen ligase family protein [Thiobacillus sp.]|nr:O-antigen ligase family protein [Thiobacillus sp.]HQT70022.1 O-antigen ligase family protein [Thiobacillus sp.]
MTGLALFAGIAIDFVPELIWHDQQRMEQIVLLLIAALALATIWRKSLLVTLARLPTPIRLALPLGFTLGCTSAVLAAYPRFALLEWGTLLLLLGVAFVLAEQTRRGGVGFDTWAIRLVVALAAVIALKIMTGYVATIVEGARLNTLQLFEGTFSNRRVFGQVASMAIPLLAYPLLSTEMPRVRRWSLFALLAVWWMLVIVSGTRGTWMALAVAAVVLAAVAWRASSGWLRMQAWAFGAGALLFAILFVGLPAWLELDASLENRFVNPATLSGRGELWALAWGEIQAHPWLGIGPMHLASIHNGFGAHPHNAVLQLAAEWGVPAALAFVAPVAAGLFYLLLRIRRQETSVNALLICLTASLLAASAQSMVDGVIVIAYTQTWLVLIAGWVLGVYFRDGARAPVISDFRMMRLGVPVLSLFAFAGLLNGVLPEIFNRAEVTQAYADAGKLIPPRYWGVGWIP